MQIIMIDKPLYKDIPVLVDDDLRPIIPVYRFILYLLQRGCQKNTVKNNCKALKLFYEWLKIKKMDYHQMVEEPSEIVSNFSEYRFWLKYPDYDPKLIPMNGYQQAREVSTINVYMSVLTNYYDFLTIDEGLPVFNFYKELSLTGSFHGFLSEMTNSREHLRRNIFHEKAPKKALKYISREQYHQLREVANNKRDKLIMAFLFECGMRVSDICALYIEDLKDFREQIIHIVDREGHENPDAACKYSSEKDIAFPAYLIDEIADFLANEVIGVDTNYVFFNMYSTNKYSPIRESNIEAMVRNAGNKLGIENLHPHMFRHGIATDMLENGCDMVQIQDKLRHKSISTTKDIYAHSTSKIRRQAQEEYEQAVRKSYQNQEVNIDDLASFLSGGLTDE